MSIISTPPLLRGGQAEQLAAIRSYLYQLAEQLNQSMNSLTVENFAPGPRRLYSRPGAATRMRCGARWTNRRRP